MPTVRQFDEDLIAESLADVLDYLKQKGGPLAEAEMGKLARIIVRRRIADQLRRDKSASKFAPTPQGNVSQEDRMAAQEVLSALEEVLLTFSSADRDVLVLELGASDQPRDSAARKRLQRVREKLRAGVETKLGVPLERLFGGADDA